MSQPILGRDEDFATQNSLTVATNNLDTRLVAETSDSISEISSEHEIDVVPAQGKFAQGIDAIGRGFTKLQTVQNRVKAGLTTPINFAPVSEEEFKQLKGAKLALQMAKNVFQGVDSVSAKAASAVFGLFGLVRKAEVNDLTGIVSSIVTNVVAAAARGVTLVAGTVLAVAVSIVALVVGTPVYGIYRAGSAVKNAIAGKIEERKELADQASREAFLDKNLSKLIMINAGSKLSSNNVQTLKNAIAFASQHLPEDAEEGQEVAPTRFPQAQATAELVVGILEERLGEVQERIARQAAIAQAQLDAMARERQVAQAQAQARAQAEAQARAQAQPVVVNQAPVVVNQPQQVVVDSSDDSSSESDDEVSGQAQPSMFANIPLVGRLFV